ncbi:hypothetical protein KP509_14G028500 [Ceratopteris richardii]|uniref:Uncharacterized protein n=1 Tax=Ceratopteris richardii TaxID=49495 RepID=A0A8T2TAG5_CERRI|nr:hypothetical protein KP509_14G028500 [Ceratopteris richardii]
MTSRYSRKDLGVSYVKEKQLRVNMGISKLRQKVKEHQKRVGQKLNTVAKTAGMHHSEWVENADRWVSGFLEKFEEGCHVMVKAAGKFKETKRTDGISTSDIIMRILKDTMSMLCEI